MIHAVIDTNILIRAFIKPQGTVGPALTALRDGRYTIVYAPELLDELIEKFSLPRIRLNAHYDTISAFIKSVRGSDPDAALYWLAKMIYAGEDPRFILRRLIILAGEDIGLADPLGLAMAASAASAAFAGC